MLAEGRQKTIGYVKVQGVPNEEMIRPFGEADLVADRGRKARQSPPRGGAA
jgi:hypothetical protein